MKTIDILRFISPEARRMMSERRLLRANVLRDMEIYEAYVALRDKGKAAMDVYGILAERFCLEADTIQRITAKMSK